MSRPDLNLLVALDALLAEGNVLRAARRLHLSPSAMSRTLARLRETTGDPLLVRAGRGLIPTPRALELREKIGRLVQESEAALRPAEQPNLSTLVRTFTIRSSDGFVENFGPALIARIANEAPGVRLRFVQKLDKESAQLRDGSVDLETGVIDPTTAPELRAQALFRDRFIAAVRNGHPLTEGELTAARYAAARHILVSRRPASRGASDERGVLNEPGLIESALAAISQTREITTIVTGFSAAIALARTTDLVATVPERQTANLRGDLQTLALPFATPELTVSMLWHPRLHADPVHRWLRDCVKEVCAH